MTLNNNRAGHAVRVAVLSALAIFAAPISSAHAEKIQLDVAAGEAPDALKEFIRQTGLQLIFDFDSIAAFKTHAVSGQYDAAEALTRMLSNTGLAFEFVNERTVTVTRKEAITQRPKVIPTKVSYERDAIATSEVERVRLAQAVEAAASSHETSALESASKEDLSERRVQLEEVVVTGSHIRGAQNLSSPIIQFDREAIDRGGYATTQQLIQSLPQNLNNVSDSTQVGQLNGGPGGSFSGSGINLRGLGSASTLVLVNGRRLAPSGTSGSFVDVSTIPLSAIERVDVLTDGASAIYGSDAVGGVVNLVLRNDFQGAETRLRYGSVTQGSHSEWQAGQILGSSWDSGNAMLSYEFYDRTELDGSDRDFYRPKGSVSGFKLIPEQRRHGAFGLVSQDVTSRIELFGSARFGQRETEYSYRDGLGDAITKDKVEQYGASAGLKAEFGKTWQVQGAIAIDESHSQARDFTADTALPTSTIAKSNLRSLDVIADGAIAHLRGGEARLALGSQFREEQIRTDYAYSTDEPTFSRETYATFAELSMPWIGPVNALPGVQRLETTFAARYEHYSDFGKAFDPKLGFSWIPVAGLNIRGTWGTSFRAPLLTEMNPADVYVDVFPDLVPEVGGTSTAMFVLGSGVELKPEESTNLSLGFDLTIQKLDVSFTYFDIDYEHRIRSPFPAGYNFDVITDPRYSPVVSRNFDPSEIARLLATPYAICFTPDYDICSSMPTPEQIDVVVDGRITNLARVRTNGFDFSASYNAQAIGGAWQFGIAGTKLLRNDEQLMASMPHASIMNNVWAPVDLKLRNSLSYSREAFSAVGFINYVDSYKDQRSALWSGGRQGSKVGSWTTVDVTLQYELGGVLGWQGFKEVTASVSGRNILDRDPPFIGHLYGLHFDGVNANPLGRFISAQVVGRW